MTADLAPSDVDWPGVVVVGGGATGLLTALALDRQGVPTLVLEHSTLCSGQTGQCHGWLHRGAVFPDATADDLDQLDRGARAWERLAAGAESIMECHVAGVSERTRRSAMAVWDRSGLRHRSVAVRGVAARWLLSGPETAVVPRDILASAVAGSSVVLRRARAVGLRPGPDGTAAEQLRVAAGECEYDVSAAGFVIAGGTGLDPLLPGIPGLTRRLSFMVVARSATVGETGVAIPEQEALGLFAVPRLVGTRRFLLISNFMSYAPPAHLGDVRRSWLNAMRSSIRRFLPDLWAADDARWGVYPATKVEPARHLVLGMPRAMLLPSPYANVAAAVPGKLTLAPLVAERLAEAVLPFASRTRAAAQAVDTVVDLLPPARWGPEEWEVIPLVRRATLFSDIDGP